MHRALAISLKIIGTLAFTCLLALASGFFAVRFGLTNVAGEEDVNSFEYNKLYDLEKSLFATSSIFKTVTTSTVATVTTSTPAVAASPYGLNEQVYWCKIKAAARVNDYNAYQIFSAFRQTKSATLLDRMILAMKLRSPDKASFDRLLIDCKQPALATSSEAQIAADLENPAQSNLFTWQNDQHWQTIEKAVIKDKDIIKKVSSQTGIEQRLLVSVLIVEQIRLYYTQRELYEKFFEPLKILANANKMAWGIMSIKEKMATQTEEHLSDVKSTFYPGADYQKLLEFPTDANIPVERYNRLTDNHNHYYSYLYGALILKQLTAQWQKAGFDIHDRPEILATLFNIGFDHSKPKAEPAVGGSTIDIGDDKYFFGSLAYEFYYSGALAEEFSWEQ